jgi:hypothetical protein
MTPTGLRLKAASDAGAVRISRRVRLEPKHFPPEWFTPRGLRKREAFHVPYGRYHEHHFPDRGRVLHFDWNVLKGTRHLGNAQPMRGLGLRKLDG